jgi:hypothetical protein
MTDRLSLWPILSAHWKSLSIDGDDGTVKGDWTARMGLLIPALAAAGTVGAMHISLANVGSLLAADALLAGSLLSVFAQISSLRLKLSDRFEAGFADADADKDAMDETASHLLFAVMLAFINAAVLAAALAFEQDKTSVLGGIFGAVSVALFVYTVLLMLMLLPRLLYAYTTVNSVRKELSGFHRS